MKTAKRLNPVERAFLRQQGFTPKYFLRLKKTAESYEFVEVTSGKILTLRR